MHTKLAGHMPLQELISHAIDSARTKLAEAEDKDKKPNPFAKKDDKDKKPNPFAKKDDKKPNPFAKKDDDGDDDDDKEKQSAAIDTSNAYEVEKLAEALDEMGDSFLKVADSVDIGGEKPQGGMVLPTGTPISGTQSYKKDGSKIHHPQADHTPLQAKKENGTAATAVADTENHPPVPLTARYPVKGVLKTAGGQTHKEKEAFVGLAVQGLGAVVGHHYGTEQKKKGQEYSFGVPQGAGALLLPGGIGYQAGRYVAHHSDSETSHGKKHTKEKRSAAMDFILNKIAESSQGGETLDSPAGEGPQASDAAVGGNSARKALESATAAINMKKIDGKAPQKRMLSEILREPALSKTTDSTLQNNLRNTGKAGVKIAAAKAFLAKIAADPTDPRHEALKAAIAKKKEEKEKKSSANQ